MVRLCEAAGEALAHPASWPNLLVLSSPLSWLAAGADLEADILPSIRARAMKRPKGSIRAWSYFDSGVAEARSRRLAGLAPVPVQAMAGEDYQADLKRRLSEAMAQVVPGRYTLKGGRNASH